MSTLDKLKQIESLTSAVRVLAIPLGTAVVDRAYHIVGGMIGGWLAPLSTDEVQIRFNDRSANAIPFRPGLALEIPFKTIFLTCPGTGAGTFYLLYGDPDWVKMIVNSSDLGGALEGILNELQGDATPENWGNAAVGLVQAQVLAANANRKGFEVQSGLGNAGTIYVGFDNTVTALHTAKALVAGQSFWRNDYLGPVHCIASAAGQVLHYLEV